MPALVARVKLVLSDVDGTLVTSDKRLTARSVAAVAALGDAGIRFALTSARPPQGLAAYVEALSLTTPLGAFNGGVIVDPQLRVLAESLIEADLAHQMIDVLKTQGLAPWVYQGAHWYVTDVNAPHVAHEAAVSHDTPEEVANYSFLAGGVAKIVGVSDDDARSAAALEVMRERFSSRASVSRSQSYYLDVTDLAANKGRVVHFLSAYYDLAPEEIATIGDMHNDVAMFEASGLSIAMGNAAPDVRERAREVTTSNDDEGFATAIERFILDA
ncbi:MAG: HAD family phosphatase [Acidobacteriota bacterium]|nr:HAD family phosphatase [Acidobacteriota bacterium]